MATRWRRAGARDPEVQSITSARRPLREEVHDRTTRYLISMGVRTVCFVLAAVTDGPLRWAFVTAAVLLPYIAVVVANAGRERVEKPDSLLPTAALGPGASRPLPYDPDTEYLR